MKGKVRWMPRGGDPMALMSARGSMLGLWTVDEAKPKGKRSIIVTLMPGSMTADEWRERLDMKFRRQAHDALVHTPDNCPQCRSEVKINASPIEVQFWAAYQQLKPREMRGLVREYKVGPYRIDFALPRRKIGIELDGHASHSTTTAIAADRRRQRALEAAGWRIIRFGGAEVYCDAKGCVREAARAIKKR